MAHRRGTRFARTRGNGNRPVGEVRTSVTVAGDVSGQLAVGSHIVQMRVDTVLGNLVTVLPPDARAAITPRPVPVHLVPRRPAIMIGRQREITLAVDSLSVQRPVEIHAPPGMGKSTLLRFLAHNAPIAEVCGGVAHLSARRLSHDDLLQVLFDVFYSADIPVKPSPGELRHHLQHVRAALLLDDVELSDDEMADLEDYAPGCGFAMASTAGGGAGEACLIELSGLRGPDATVLFSHALGRPLRHDEQSAITPLCNLAGGAPAGIPRRAERRATPALGTRAGGPPGGPLRPAAAARDFSGTLAEFAASAVSSAVP